MKNASFVCFIVLVFFSTALAGDAVTINPGGERTLTVDPATGGSASNNGNVTFILDSAFSTSAKTIKAEASGGLSIGKGVASSQIFYEFEVGSTPQTADHTVGAWINYSIDWQGFQVILGSLGTNASVLVELALRDVTDSANLHVETLHDLDLQTYSLEFLDVGLNHNDSGAKVGTFAAVLKRGHTYRLTLRMSTTLIILVSSGLQSMCDYMNGFTGGGNGEVGLNSLYVKVGLDEKEVLERLDGFVNHRHTYLTGRGEGHNNTEASSSPPILQKTTSPKLIPELRLEEMQSTKP